MKRRHVLALVLLPFFFAAVAIAGVLFLRQGGLAPYLIPATTREVPSDPDTLARGEYLARVGNCGACHTARGGTPFAGGRSFITDAGTLYSTNLTPDVRSGIGAWSVDEFAHVLRNGVSRRGALYPVFPFEHFALLADADVDAIYAYLRSLPASPQSPPDNRLEGLARWRAALVGWRMLYYRPDPAAAAQARSDRGRYLVDGLGHCAMCHSERGPQGSLPAEGYLAGGRIPGIGWYAPSLDRDRLARYSESELADYLRSGTSPHGDAYGPMAEVVYASLRALSEDDALAMARYLKQVPARSTRSALLPAPEAAPTAVSAIDGEALYRQDCADCHGRDGKGKVGAYPPLQASVAATAPDPIDAVRMVLYGGMPVTTEANPRPHSMPPFVQRRSPSEIAALVNYIRTSFGAQPSRLTASDIEAMHGLPLD